MGGVYIWAGGLSRCVGNKKVLVIVNWAESSLLHKGSKITIWQYFWPLGKPYEDLGDCKGRHSEEAEGEKCKSTGVE